MTSIPPVHDFGYDPSLDAAVTLSSPLPASATPAPAQGSVNLSYLPPVGTQGTVQNPGAPATCTAWASAYALATFVNAKKTGVAPTDNSLIASPADIYVRVRQEMGASKPPCLGTSYRKYFDLLASEGTYSMEAAPYYNDCATLWSTYASMPAPSQSTFVVSSINTVNTKDLAGIKLLLTQNCPVAYGTRLYHDWNAYQGVPPVYIGSLPFAMGRDGPVRHSMLIIGYDDVRGAFHIQNSQGTAWGIDGYVWMAYDTFSALAEPTAFYAP